MSKTTSVQRAERLGALEKGLLPLLQQLSEMGEYDLAQTLCEFGKMTAARKAFWLERADAEQEMAERNKGVAI